jgi:uncharacterized beta-barrel protein YwiB (DUF1934 family)
MAMEDVMLKITGKSYFREDGEVKEDNVIEFITEGKIGTVGRSTLIVYPEMEEYGMGGVTTHITITPKKVKVRRSTEWGDDENLMEFEEGKRFNGIYVTPYGNFGLELLTDKLSGLGKSAAELDKISIDYSLSVKGLSESRNSFDIEILSKPGKMN